MPAPSRSRRRCRCSHWCPSPAPCRGDPVVDPVLRSRRLSYTYPGAAARALDSIDLEVEAGEMVVLAGPSASGKTTLLRAACGLVPHFHGGEVSGELEVAGL